MKALQYTTALCIALLALVGCTQHAPTGVAVLTYASPYGPGHPFSRADIAWMHWVEQQSHDTLRIRPYWSGSVISAEQSMTELRHGVVDIGLITPIYARGGAHLIRVQAAFYAGVKTFDDQVALYDCLADHDPQIQHETRGLVVLAVQGGNLPGILTRDRPVRTLADLRGMRLRAPGELLGVLKYFGADPVDMPMGNVYSALAKGVIDGVIAPMDTFKSLHFAEVAHYFNTLPIPRGAYAARAMGLKRWRELTPRQQALLHASTAVWEAALRSDLQNANHAGEQDGRAHGIQFFDMPADDARQFLTVYNRFAARNAKSLQRFGIDGLAAFRYARATAERIEADTQPICPGT